MNDRMTIDFTRFLAQCRGKCQRIAGGPDEHCHLRGADAFTVRHVHHPDRLFTETRVFPVLDHSDDFDVEHAWCQPDVSAYWILVAEVVTREGPVEIIMLAFDRTS